MREHSPPDSVRAFDIDKLRAPDVTFWSAWVGEDLAGCGALKLLDNAQGELKSMRVADVFLGRGILPLSDRGGASPRARATVARDRFGRGVRARAPPLRESAGFERCDPFDGYVEDPFSIFMTREL